MRAAAVFLLFFGNLSAQTTTGGIRGTLFDSKGAAIPNASVELRSESLSFRESVATDSSGGYRFLRLAPGGDYGITVNAPGMEAWRTKGIHISTGEITTFDITVSIAAQRSAVEVVAATPDVVPESTELSSVVSAKQLSNLPTNGRNFVRFALMDSRVRNTSGLGGDGFAQNRLSINGTSFRDTQWRLDGNTNYDTLFNNSPLQRLSISSIQEFRVLTNQFNAEHGSTSVGLVITTTKSGTDEFHGEAFFYGRPSGIQARPPLANLRIPNQLLQEGGAVGGPIAKGRTYFFGNYERLNQDRGSFVNGPVPGFYVGAFQDNLALAKFDHRVSDTHWISARISGSRDRNDNPNDAVGGLNQASTARYSLGQTVSSQVTDTVTWRGVVNELRAGYINSVPSNTVPVNPQVVVNRAGYSTEGYASYSTARTEVYQLADQVSWQRGTHTFKAGGDFIRRKVRDLQFDSFGSYTFPAGPPVEGVGPILYTQRFGTARMRYGQTQWAGFVQDTWRVVPRLTLNLGLRYDYQSLLDDFNNFGPRVGFAWDVTGKQSTTLRGGYGLYYDQPFFHGLTQRFLLNAVDAPFVTYQMAPNNPAFPVFPHSYPADAPPSGLSLAPRSIVQRNSTLLGPYTQQWTLGIQQRLPGQWLLAIDGIRSLAVKQFLHYNLNAPSAFPRTSPGQMRTVAEADATRPMYDPTLGVSMYQGVPVRDVRITTNGNTATYHALSVSLSRRLGSRYQTNFSYTYSSALNSITDDHLGANPNEWSDVQRAERGLSDFAQRNRFVANGIAALPWKIQASAYALVASGLPVNATTGVDNNGDSTVVDRPAGFGRNAFRGPRHVNFDLSLMRPILLSERTRLELRADAFNLFNNQNYYAFNRVYGNTATPAATFLQPLAGIANTDPGRQFTFGLKFLF